MKKILSMPLGLILCSVFIISCTTDPVTNLSNEESRIYITDHDSSVNFSNYNTYSISDFVAVIENGSSSRELSPVFTYQL
ncbi:MAG TPA: hypothetical protein VIL78_21580 [Hanamia sp.]